MNNVLSHTGERPGMDRRSATRVNRILVMGPSSRAIAGALVRMKGAAEIHHAENAAEAVSLLRDYRFDNVLIDNLSDGALALTIPRLAALENVSNLIVLAGPKSAETISAIPGVGLVLQPPFNPLEIANSIGLEVVDNRKSEGEPRLGGKRAEDIAAVEEISEVKETEQAPVETQTAEAEPPLFIRMLSAAVHIIPGLTPLLSILYKNLAITILAGLFAAFISYGVMIAFFLVSGDWSAPMQLQPGHELVVKADRDLKELQVKRNLVTQQIADANNKLNRSSASLDRAKTLAEINLDIIRQEQANRENSLQFIKEQKASLETVLAGFGTKETRRRNVARLEREFRQRVITRHTYQQGLLVNAETERQIVNLRERISDKAEEINEFDQAIDYLRRLENQIASQSDSIATSGRAEFVPLVNQIIEVRQLRSNAEAERNAADQAIPSLQNSLQVLNKGINTLQTTPMIRALEKPVNVLFVPYDNLNSFSEGESLYACAFGVFWCSNVGTTGQPISGEITTVHPFFGKPIRGQFIEAELDNNETSQKEILHVGRPPFFF